jgi:hypothetical protein
LQRAHLFEFNDMPWLPAPVRQTLMEFLHQMSVQLRMYESGFEELRRVLDRTGVRTLQALCSGDGGTTAALCQHLKRDDLRVMLSDKFPPVERYRELEHLSGGRLGFVEEPVDALDVPEHLSGLRLVVNAVHHFHAPQVRAMLADAVRRGQPIVFLEPLRRDVPSLLRFAAAAPVFCLYSSLGGTRPLSARRLLLGTVVPVGTLCFVFDGIVSHLRAWSPSELQAIIQEVPGHEGYDWDVRELKGVLGASLTFLAGTPREAA